MWSGFIWDLMKLDSPLRGSRWKSFMLALVEEGETEIRGEDLNFFWCIHDGCKSQGGPQQRRSRTTVLCPNTAVEPVYIHVCLCTHTRLSAPSVPTGVCGWGLNKFPAPSHSPESKHLSAHIISSNPWAVIKKKAHSAFFLFSSVGPFIHIYIHQSVWLFLSLSFQKF